MLPIDWKQDVDSHIGTSHTHFSQGWHIVKILPDAVEKCFCARIRAMFGRLKHSYGLPTITVSPRSFVWWLLVFYLFIYVLVVLLWIEKNKRLEG